MNFDERLGVAVVQFTVSALLPTVEPRLAEWQDAVLRTQKKYGFSRAAAHEKTVKEFPDLHAAWQAATREKHLYFSETFAVEKLRSAVLCVPPEAAPQTVRLLGTTSDTSTEFQPIIDEAGKPAEIQVEPGRSYEIPPDIFGKFTKFEAEMGKDFSAKLILRGETLVQGNHGTVVNVRHTPPRSQGERLKDPAIYVGSATHGRLHVPADAKPQTICVLVCEGETGDFCPVHDWGGKAGSFSFQATPNAACILPAALFKYAHVRFQAEAGGDFAGVLVLSKRG